MLVIDVAALVGLAVEDVAEEGDDRVAAVERADRVSTPAMWIVAVASAVSVVAISSRSCRSWAAP